MHCVIWYNEGNHKDWQIVIDPGFWDTLVSIILLGRYREIKSIENMIEQKGKVTTLIAMLCADDNGGTMFNHRRQSQDRALRKRILELVGEGPLWMSAYSARQFSAEDQQSIRQAETPLAAAGEGEFCFLEGDPLLPYEKKLESVILFRWNRVYPSDTCIDIRLDEQGWNLVELSEFKGYSHERITQEVYRR